jgi:hypothetical protein
MNGRTENPKYNGKQTSDRIAAARWIARVRSHSDTNTAKYEFAVFNQFGAGWLLQ